MKWISHKSFMPFVWYRIALGVVVIVLVSAGVLSPHAGESGG
ncbi:UDP pyrophosphate phosphatase [Streptomyces sp. LBUM 1478]|nr:UDP pyrophosphate phosphatase [Streptomyces sp. LBUM 1478]